MEVKMEQVCPLCNGLKKLDKFCIICGAPMKDGGKIADYYDEYSPYLPIEITARIDGVPENQCVHLLFCERCGWDHRVAIDRVYM